MKHTRSKAALGGAAVLAAAALTATLVPGAATASGDHHHSHHYWSANAHAELNPLNNSGVTGEAQVHTHHDKLRIDVHAKGLAEGLPHAQHIHYGAQARQECPAVGDDANGDFRLSTTEGAPAYGPIRVSLTKRGDTSPASGLAVDRFPTAPDGHIHYKRMTTTEKDVARAIRRGEGVVVIHGVDYNDNGVYDFGSAGRSDLDPSLPAEATDPATCGVLMTK